MKRKNLFSIIASFAMATCSISAQTSDFKPAGKPIVKIFADYFYNSQDSKSNTGFELTRAYIGYGYNFSEKFSGKAVLDVGDLSTDSKYTAYLKNALVEYKDKMFTINFGLIGTSGFSLQEKTWGKRYLQKSFQDLNGFGSSADLGASVKIDFAPEISLDLSLLNGEGYKKIQADSTLQVAAGLTIKPVKGLSARIYADYLTNNDDYNPGGKAQTSFNAFLGYTSPMASVGAEYNYQKNHKNVDKYDLNGFSIYGTVTVAPKWNVFARFDNLSSKDDINEGYKAGKIGTYDGSLYIAGLEYNVVKGIKVSPNLQIFDPKKDGGKNLTTGFLNVEMAF